MALSQHLPRPGLESKLSATAASHQWPKMGLCRPRPAVTCFVMGEVWRSHRLGCLGTLLAFVSRSVASALNWSRIMLVYDFSLASRNCSQSNRRRSELRGGFFFIKTGQAMDLLGRVRLKAAFQRCFDLLPPGIYH